MEYGDFQVISEHRLNLWTGSNSQYYYLGGMNRADVKLHALSNIASNKRDAPLGIYINDREQIQRYLGCLEDILSR